VSGVLVVGADGLIGRAVLAVARRSAEAHALVGRASATEPDAHVVRLSAATVDPLARLLERLDPVAIVNAAGLTSGAPDELWEANVGSVTALLEAMHVAGSGARLVHLGSAAEYAEVPAETTDEEAPLRAASPYAAAKVEASRLVLESADRGLATVVARVFNPIGAGMPPTSLPGRAARLLHEAAVGRAAEIELGPLDAVRDYVDVRDVATAVHLLASEPRLAFGAYNVGSGTPTLVRDLVAMIVERVGFAGEVRETAAAASPSHGVQRQVADIGRIRSAGWAPAVELRESVEALVAGIGEEVGPA
jgi:NDP-hexose 4-ketoreductase